MVTKLTAKLEMAMQKLPFSPYFSFLPVLLAPDSGGLLFRWYRSITPQIPFNLFGMVAD